MKFHVWDFSDKMEVRFNDAFIDRIKDLTVEKKVRVREKRGRHRDYIVTRRVKLIAHRKGHPYHKIAERLYPELEWHGKGRNRLPHRSFINIKQFFTVHEVTDLSLEEMERNVIAVRNHWAGHLEIPMKFPVVADENWAWLFGLWFSCGGLITRRRKGKGGYMSEEHSVRFRIDTKVFEKKVKPLLKRIAYVPKLAQVWYAKKGMRHSLDKNRRKGVGNHPRKFFTLVRPVREIMEKIGLPGTHLSQKHIKGGRYAARKFKLTIPSWIKENSKNVHAFIEGYINGSTIGSEFRRAPKGHLRRTVEIRFSGFNKKEVDTFYRFFEEYLTKLGITGYPHKDLHVKTSKLYWRGYLIHRNSSLRILYEKFDITKPDVRSRLALNYFMNPLLYEVCRELDSSEILILGALIEKPLSEQELVNLFRFRAETVNVALQRLLKNKTIQTDGHRYFVEIAVFNSSLSSFLPTRLQFPKKEVIV